MRHLLKKGIWKASLTAPSTGSPYTSSEHQADAGRLDTMLLGPCMTSQVPAELSCMQLRTRISLPVSERVHKLFRVPPLDLMSSVDPATCYDCS